MFAAVISTARRTASLGVHASAARSSQRSRGPTPARPRSPAAHASSSATFAVAPRVSLPRALHPDLRAGLVEHVDRAVGQLVVAQVAGRELCRRFERFLRVADAMVPLVARAQPLQDLDRLLNRRLVDDDLLQPPRERAVLLDVLELFVRRRADQRAAGPSSGSA